MDMLVSTPLRGFFVAELAGGSQGGRHSVSTPLRGFFVAEAEQEAKDMEIIKFQPPCGVFLLLRQNRKRRIWRSLSFNPLAGFFCC